MNAVKNRKLTVFVVLLCLCLVAGAVTGAVAFLTDKTDSLSNEFTPAKVTCAVEERFDNGIKENVTVKNTGNIDSYIRAAVVATFVSDDGKVFATAPKEGTDYTVDWGTDGWQKGSDGFWYYTKAVAPDAATSALIERAVAVAEPDGYSLNLQIFATAFQASPAKAVEEAWDVTVENGNLIP